MNTNNKALSVYATVLNFIRHNRESIPEVFTPSHLTGELFLQGVPAHEVVNAFRMLESNKIIGKYYPEKFYFADFAVEYYIIEQQKAAVDDSSQVGDAALKALQKIVDGINELRDEMEKEKTKSPDLSKIAKDDLVRELLKRV